MRRISALGQSAMFAQIGAELPGLLAELGAAFTPPPTPTGPLFGLLAEAYTGLLSSRTCSATSISEAR